LSALQITRLRPPDVKFVGTPQNVVEAMALAKVTPVDVADLGPGTADSVRREAVRRPRCRHGIDRSTCGWAGRHDQAGSAQRRFLNEDLFSRRHPRPTVVTIFLLPKLNLQLIPFRRGWRAGRASCPRFDIGDEWPPGSRT
jgi:hypothetical protein